MGLYECITGDVCYLVVADSPDKANSFVQHAFKKGLIDPKKGMIRSSSERIELKGLIGIRILNPTEWPCFQSTINCPIPECDKKLAEYKAGLIPSRSFFCQCGMTWFGNP